MDFFLIKNFYEKLKQLTIEVSKTKSSVSNTCTQTENIFESDQIINVYIVQYIMSCTCTGVHVKLYNFVDYTNFGITILCLRT